MANDDCLVTEGASPNSGITSYDAVEQNINGFLGTVEHRLAGG